MTHLQKRNIFLGALKNGGYKKGCTKSDELGRPVFDKPSDADGSCACGIMVDLFPNNGKHSLKIARDALKLSVIDCQFIQEKLNDTDLDFSTIASQIEKFVFNRDERSISSTWRKYRKLVSPAVAKMAYPQGKYQAYYDMIRFRKDYLGNDKAELDLNFDGTKNVLQS